MFILYVSALYLDIVLFCYKGEKETDFKFIFWKNYNKNIMQTLKKLTYSLQKKIIQSLYKKFTHYNYIVLQFLYYHLFHHLKTYLALQRLGNNVKVKQVVKVDKRICSKFLRQGHSKNSHSIR